MSSRVEAGNPEAVSVSHATSSLLPEHAINSGAPPPGLAAIAFCRNRCVWPAAARQKKKACKEYLGVSGASYFSEADSPAGQDGVLPAAKAGER